MGGNEERKAQHTDSDEEGIDWRVSLEVFRIRRLLLRVGGSKDEREASHGREDWKGGGIWFAGYLKKQFKNTKNSRVACPGINKVISTESVTPQKQRSVVFSFDFYGFCTNNGEVGAGDCELSMLQGTRGVGSFKWEKMQFVKMRRFDSGWRSRRLGRLNNTRFQVSSLTALSTSPLDIQGTAEDRF